MNIECPSVVARVVVHARGALVTREVSLPDGLAEGVVDVAVPGITLMAQAGSARASLEGSDRVVSAVHAALVVPSGEYRPGPTLARVRELSARAARLADEHKILSERRMRLVEIALTPHLRVLDERKRERDAFDVRFGEALQMSALLDEKVGQLDERIVRLDKERHDVARELEAARLEDRQTSTKGRMGADHPSRTITARLVGGGRPGKLLLTYAVAAARWWPAYTLRVADGGARASWTFEAIVAQKSGEDWSAVALSLSSADLVFDARLPELASLRFGRAQPPKRRPFRPAPAGVDEMFAAYQAFGGGAFRPAARIARPHAAPEEGARRAPEEGARRAPEELASSLLERDDDEDTAVNALAMPDAYEEQTRAHAPRPARGGAMPPPGAMPMMPQAMPAPAYGMMPPQQALPRKSRSLGGMFGGGGSADHLVESAAEMGAFAEPDAEPELVPGQAWSDHDALVLTSADDPRPGRLVPSGAAEDTYATTRAMREVDGAADGRYRDPADTRGMFDHRYEASGRADVPSDGRIHRVAVGTAECAVRLAWRTVPSEAPEVYREAHVVNPFETALLGGPVDVYLEGSLLTTTNVDRIDRSGTISCGMGVDDRLKIARNVRVDEESAGLLGGSTAVTHTVEIELSSTIKDPVKVTVLERVPVTDDKALEVKIVSANPVPDAYDQADRGVPVRGGCRFDVTLAPGKKTPLTIVYRLVFAQKLDIVGGSRRG